MSIRYKSVRNLLALTKDKKIKSSDVVRDIYDAIEGTDPTVKSFLALDRKNTVKKAQELDELQAEDQMDNKLFGIPMGIKDNIIINELEATCASKMLGGFVSIHGFTVMEKLHNENAVLIGKLNTDEFTMGGLIGAPYFKKTISPFDHKAVPGGSSDGSTAAVVVGLISFSLGSDTDGSIRQPAAYCGVVSMESTYGHVSRFGLVAFVSSLDQIGPLTRNAKDNAIVLEVTSGADVSDSISVPIDDVDFISEIGKDIKGLKVTLPKEYLDEGIADDVKGAAQNAAETLKSLDAVAEEVSLPNTKFGISSYYVIASSEASSNLFRFDGIRYGYHFKEARSLGELYKMSRPRGSGKEVKRRILLDTFALSLGYYDAYYKKSQKVRTLIGNDFDKVFEGYDVVVGPTTPTTTFNLGKEIDGSLTTYANGLLTTSVNLAGLPGISVPCGQSNDRPVGLQFIGKPFDEKMLYRVVYQHKTQCNLYDIYEKL